jgi:CheY-like chemotaxis protein
VNAKPVILVVEDEPLLRMAAIDMVEKAGFEVVDAANATEAVSILESRTDIRVVFSDIDMPRGMDGMKLAALIRDRWPPIEIILVSGHVAAPEVQLPARSVFFSKPYRETDIVGAIKRFSLH